MKKLLHISDYITLFGGIEMYIHSTSKLLRNDGFVIKEMGLHLPVRWLKKMRSILLPCTGCNIISAIQIIYQSIIFKPDIIWFHSVSRYHGRLPVLVSGMFDSQKLIMYHDLGYFHPYPSKLTQEEQILPWGFENWLKMANVGTTFWSMRKLLVSLKFMGMSMLRWSLLKVVDKHLVPSEFMVKYLIDWGVKKSSIEVLPHFIP